MNNRKKELIGILVLILSLCIFVSLLAFDSTEEPQISPNVKLTNTMGIIGIYVSDVLIKKGFGYTEKIFAGLVVVEVLNPHFFAILNSLSPTSL